MKQQDTYFDLQSTALDHAIAYAQKRGYEVNIPNFLWTEHVNYGHTQKYALLLTKDGKDQRKMLHISLYRMETGRYELTCYIN